MKNLTILNSKQLKPIKQLLSSHFNSEFNFSQYAVLINQKNKIYIANKDIFSIDTTKLKINSIGLYFAQLKNNELRLSIEGSQLVGPISKKNIINLNDNEFNQWIQGIDIDIPLPPPQVQQKHHLNNTATNNQFFIIRHNNDYIGCGKVKDNKILNYVPKTRRINVK